MRRIDPTWPLPLHERNVVNWVGGRLTTCRESRTAGTGCRETKIRTALKGRACRARVDRTRPGRMRTRACRLRHAPAPFETSLKFKNISLRRTVRDKPTTCAARRKIKQKQPPDRSAPCALLSCHLNRLCLTILDCHRRSSFRLR